MNEVKQLPALPEKKLKFKYGEVAGLLSKPFPAEAMTTDNSRGFALTSIKAQYIVERLNEVLGIDGWQHRGRFEKVEEGVLFHGELVLDNGGQGIMQLGTGFSKDKKNVGDSYKSAKTDSLSKSASLFGVGNDVYKGKVPPPSGTSKTSKSNSKGSDF